VKGEKGEEKNNIKQTWQKIMWFKSGRSAGAKGMRFVDLNSSGRQPYTGSRGLNPRGKARARQIMVGFGNEK